MEKMKLKYKLALLKSGMTQRKLSYILKFSETYISYLIAGKRKNRKFDLWVEKHLNLSEFDGVII